MNTRILMFNKGKYDIHHLIDINLPITPSASIFKEDHYIKSKYLVTILHKYST